MSEPAIGSVVPHHNREEDNDSVDILEGPIDDNMPTPDYYLPDMKNTQLSEARKRAIQWGSNRDEYLVDCPEIEKFYGVSILLVDFRRGMCQLFSGREPELFPLQASEEPFSLTLLEKVLASDAEKRITPAKLPGSKLTTVLHKPLDKSQLQDRFQAFSDLVGMHAENQIKLQHVQLQPVEKMYREISRLETKGRRIETRMDELLAVFMADNTLRDLEGLKTYSLPKINPINKDISTKIQANKYAVESYQEGVALLRSAFEDNREPFKAVSTPLSTADRVTDRQDRPTEVQTQATVTGRDRSSSPTFNLQGNKNPLTIRTMGEQQINSFIVPTMATKPRNRQDNRSTVTFNSKPTVSTSTVNQRLMEIAGMTPATDHLDRPTDTHQNPTNINSNSNQVPNKSKYNYYNKNYNGRTWENSTNRACNTCGERGHLQKDCTKYDLYCTFCHTRTHNTAACKSKPRDASTPLESPSAGNYHPAPSPRQHNTSNHNVDPNKSIIPTHVMQPSPIHSSYNEEFLQAWITRMDKDQAHKREVAGQKRIMDNIEVYDGNDKTKCLPWVNRIHQAATNSAMEFREALVAKAGPTVFEIIVSTPKDIDHLELKKIILQNFSDVATPSEAAQKLRTMRM